MADVPSPQSRCPSCNGTRLSPPATAFSFEHSVGVQVPLCKEKRTFFGGRSIDVRLLGRVCADCGHVSVFAGGEGLEELRKRWADLDWTGR